MTHLVQVALAAADEGLFERLCSVLRGADGQIVRAFESTRPEHAGSGVEEYTIIVAGLSVEAVTLVCSGFVNRFRLAQVEVEREVVAGPRVII